MTAERVDCDPPCSADSIKRAVEAVRRFARSLWLDLIRRDQSADLDSAVAEVRAVRGNRAAPGPRIRNEYPLVPVGCAGELLPLSGQPLQGSSPFGDKHARIGRTHPPHARPSPGTLQKS